VRTETERPKEIKQKLGFDYFFTRKMGILVTAIWVTGVEGW